MNVEHENTAARECNFEFTQKMCRICLQTYQEMNHLFSLQFPTDLSEVVVFLRRITELKVKVNKN